MIRHMTVKQTVHKLCVLVVAVCLSLMLPAVPPEKVLAKPERTEEASGAQPTMLTAQATGAGEKAAEGVKERERGAFEALMDNVVVRGIIFKYLPNMQDQYRLTYQTSWPLCVSYKSAPDKALEEMRQRLYGAMQTAACMMGSPWGVVYDALHKGSDKQQLFCDFMPRFLRMPGKDPKDREFMPRSDFYAWLQGFEPFQNLDKKKKDALWYAHAGCALLGRGWECFVGLPNIWQMRLQRYLDIARHYQFDPVVMGLDVTPIKNVPVALFDNLYNSYWGHGKGYARDQLGSHVKRYVEISIRKAGGKAGLCAVQLYPNGLGLWLPGVVELNTDCGEYQSFLTALDHMGLVDALQDVRAWHVPDQPRFWTQLMCAVLPPDYRGVFSVMEKDFNRQIKKKVNGMYTGPLDTSFDSSMFLVEEVSDYWDVVPFPVGHHQEDASLEPLRDALLDIFNTVWIIKQKLFIGTCQRETRSCIHAGCAWQRRWAPVSAQMPHRSDVTEDVLKAQQQQAFLSTPYHTLQLLALHTAVFQRHYSDNAVLSDSRCASFLSKAMADVLRLLDTEATRAALTAKVQATQEKGEESLEEAAD